MRDFDFRDDLPRLEIFEHSGHLLSWEEPERYAEAIQAFLS